MAFSFSTIGRALSLAAIILAASSASALSAMTEWASSEGGRMRMVALAPDRNGLVRAALQIEPSPGWITYWREPGDAGIPPQITPKATGNTSLKSVSFPTPSRLDAGGLQDIGYDHGVTLPLEFVLTDAKGPPRIEAGVFIGVCKNICVPFQADFSLVPHPSDVDAEATAKIIADAEKALPERQSDDFRVTAFRMMPGTDELAGTLHVELRLPADTPLQSQFFVTGPQDYAYTTVLQQVRNGRNLAIEMPIKRLPKNYSLEGKTWKILTVAGNRSMETELNFSSSKQ